MGIFGIKLESHKQYAKAIALGNEYKFMYENFIFSTQHELYLVLKKKELIEALKFNYKIYKYGYPNDEVGLPSKIPGINPNGISEVFNSKWIRELKENNRSHPKHDDSLYGNYRHFVVRFKDVTLEVISRDYDLVRISQDEFLKLVTQEISNVGDVN